MEFVGNLNNARQAAIQVGYSPRSAHDAANKLLKKPSVQAEIARLQEEQRNRLQITKDMVVDEVRNLAYSDMGNVLEYVDGVVRVKNLDQLPPAIRRCISTVKVREIKSKGRKVIGQVLEVKFWDKGAKLKELATHLGITLDRTTQHHTGDPANPVSVAMTVEQFVDGKRKAQEYRAGREQGEPTPEEGGKPSEN